MGASGYFPMSARQPSPYQSIARKWLVLAERRKAAFIELRESDRWQHYYSSKIDIDVVLLNIDRACERWAELAGASLQPVEWLL